MWSTIKTTGRWKQLREYRVLFRSFLVPFLFILAKEKRLPARINYLKRQRTVDVEYQKAYIEFQIIFMITSI